MQGGQAQGELLLLRGQGGQGVEGVHRLLAFPAQAYQLLRQALRPLGAAGPRLQARLQALPFLGQLAQAPLVGHQRLGIVAGLAGAVEGLPGLRQGHPGLSRRLYLPGDRLQLPPGGRALQGQWISDVSLRRNPSCAASRINTSDTSGRSSPSRRRLMPTSTSKSPRRRPRRISIPLDGVDVGVRVADLQTLLEEIVGEVLGHLLGERGDERAVAAP